MLRSDRILPVSLLAFLGFAYYQTGLIKGQEGITGPAFFPKMVIVVMLVLLVIITINDWRQEKKEAEQGKFRSGVTLQQGIRRYAKVILVFAMTIVYVYLLDVLGYVVDTILYLIIMSLVLKDDWKEKLPFTVVLMVVFTFGIYVIFTYLLQVQVPAARLF